MRYASGTPAWVDLETTNVAAAREFYEALFGWTSVDMPHSGTEYTQFLLDGAAVAGMGPQAAEHTTAGVPPMWNTHILVESADSTVVAVETAGGRVLMPPTDIAQEGRLAVAMDPSGAAFGIWEPRQHQGAAVVNQPGSLQWTELQARGFTEGMSFYEEVFGWRWEQIAGSGPGPAYFNAYLVARPGADPIAGGMEMPDQVPPEVPSYWLVYFAVENCEAAMARATGLGAQVFLPPMDMGPGRYCGLIDPTGAMFMVGHLRDPGSGAAGG